MTKSCIKCNEKATYFRKYSGEAHCNKCFSNSIIEKTKKTISKHKMLKYGEKIAVAVSGGKDSLVLLDILNKMSERQGSEICAITIDEGIETYREESISFSRNACNEMGIQQIVLSFEELFNDSLDQIMDIRKDKTTSCTMCGTFRRRAIEIGAKKINADVIATGHNLDDTLQTFLMNLFSGDIKRIKQSNHNLEKKDGFDFKRIKPLMEIYEEEIVYYAFVNKIPIQSIDCPHSNESIRTEIRQILVDLEKKHPGIKLNTMRSINKILDNTENISEKPLQKCEVCNFPSSDKICSVCKTVNLVSSWKD